MAALVVLLAGSSDLVRPTGGQLPPAGGYASRVTPEDSPHQASGMAAQVATIVHNGLLAATPAPVLPTDCRYATALPGDGKGISRAGTRPLDTC